MSSLDTIDYGLTNLIFNNLVFRSCGSYCIKMSAYAQTLHGYWFSLTEELVFDVYKMLGFTDTFHICIINRVLQMYELIR
jgi:hypothetical protein